MTVNYAPRLKNGWVSHHSP